MDAVYVLYPFELVVGFEVFGDVFGFCHLLDEGIEHLLSLGVDLGAVLVEGALGQERCEEYGLVCCHKQMYIGAT